MRPDDGDDDLAGGGDDDALEDGLDETVLHGTFSTSSDPYGDGLGDDTYDSGDADGTPDTGDTTGTSPPGDGGDDDGGGYGDGAGDEGGGAGDDDGSILVGQGDDDGLDTGRADLDDLDLTVHQASPLEGIGYLVDELGDALFGEDDADGAVGADPFDQDPADVSSDSDLDLTGDGVVDRADLHEARSVFDFHPGDGHPGAHGGD